jgi:NDP-sugar pyrophosphorylase family protein
MVFAAGLGTRLLPLTADRPKALVQIGGQTLLELVLCRLRSYGVREVIVNVHHFADMIVDYLQKNNHFEMCLEVSREPVLLGTGGGLKKAAPFFLGPSGASDEPFIVHNVDILSTLDLGRMVRFHREHQALATLAVRDRETYRYLLFDETQELCGRRFGRGGKDELVRCSARPQELAFSCMHVISPRLFSLMTEEGAFSIIDCYLRLAGQGEKILAFRDDASYWCDVGRPEHVLQAEQDMKELGT